MSYKLLIVDDEVNVRKLLSVVFTKEGYTCVVAENGVQALEKIAQTTFDLVLMDIQMPELNGLDTLKCLKELNESRPVLLMTAFADVETAVEALKLGAFDYIIKPFDLDELKVLVKKALEPVHDPSGDYDPVEDSDYCQYQQILTNSANMMAVCRDIAKISQTNATVLITGESGTGKELVAKAIHYNSNRVSGPFIKINCGALPEGILESTLFGHEKGAFTGAYSRIMGVFERAHGGTLLLDEVGEMSPNLQVKLLRVLQEREFEPLGGQKTITTNFRLIAATNQNLEQMITTQKFRQDLYYRLNVMAVSPPPLRERPNDIALLAEHFAQKFCHEHHKSVVKLSSETLAVLNHYTWPGNIRELSNAIERAVIMSTGNHVHPEDLPESIINNAKHQLMDTAVPTSEAHNLKDQLSYFEKALIIKALKANSGHRENTAKSLGISKRTLMYKLQEYDLS